VNSKKRFPGTVTTVADVRNGVDFVAEIGDDTRVATGANFFK